jgi:hypothetical protein
MALHTAVYQCFISQVGVQRTREPLSPSRTVRDNSLMSSREVATDCPNPNCATPAALGMCVRFSTGFGLQVSGGHMEASRWDDTHCLVCGQFSSPYTGIERPGRDLTSDPAWLLAVDRALLQTRRGGLAIFLALHELDSQDLLAMRRAGQGLRMLQDLLATTPSFPQVGLLRVQTAADVPAIFGVAHGEAESEPFASKVRVLGRLLGAQSAESMPRHCSASDTHPTWYFYTRDAFVGLLSVDRNRDYHGSETIDVCLDRLLRAE